MADPTCADVPSAGKTRGASTLLQSFPEASVQPLPANLGSVVDALEPPSLSVSNLELELQQRHRAESQQDGVASVVPVLSPEISIPMSTEPHSPRGSWHPISPSNSMATKPSSSTLSVLSAAAASLKGKTHQVAQQQKRALSAFQQKGGLVSWLHGEMEDPGVMASPGSSPLTTPGVCQPGDLCTPPSPRSPIEPTISKAGRRRSMPNLRSNSLLDNFFDKVAAVTASPPSSPQVHGVNLQPTVVIAKPSTSSCEASLHGQQTSRPNAPSTPEIGRQRAATTDLPAKMNVITGTDGSTFLKAQSAASLNPPQPETCFSLDEVLSDEWSCSVLWAHLYSSAVGRDHQHHQRLSFLIETTFRITPLYQQLARVDESTSDKEIDFKKLVTRLKRLHSRYLVNNGATALATSGVPVASPAASYAKTQLAVAIHTLNDQKMPNKVNAHVEKVISTLLQLAREVEREFRVLGTRTYVNFAVSSLYRNFITHKSDPASIATLLRAARIPFYQQPNSAVYPRCLELLKEEQHEDPQTLFSRAECQAFIITAQPDSSIKFTDMSPYTSDAMAQQSALLRMIEPFLNPSANVQSAASMPLAFNFITGSGTNAVYGAVMWLPLEQNNALGAKKVSTGFCIISKFPLVDSMRHFLSAMCKDIRCNTEATDHEVQVIKASIAMRTQCLVPPCDQLPVLDFKLDDLFDSLSLTNVLRLFAFVLLEKKIVLVASSYTILFCVSEAMRALLHPLVWSHVYVPVLPLSLKDCLHCPTPFIFGLHDSYVRRSEMPRPSNDLVVVNLDRDSLTGGGDVFLPPVRHSMMREELFRLCKPHLAGRDSVDNFDAGKCTLGAFPTAAIRRVFHKHVREILKSLEPCVNRFEFNEQSVSVVDNDNSSLWSADTVRFCSSMLHTQAVSTYLASPRSEEIENVERIFV
ncbi:hypothetical protein JG687_00016281 [Phytophthora cactorum]|uniref:UDENN domain-containing protein n=1 Tax=Phytophthora cactorum TaxID=29920 RepID=A0A8T1TUL1_9STRA|nr:hypothetical protein JG687_00016281 [Phytophthora cactorum]